MKAISLSVGRDGGKYVEGSVIVVCDDNGTPIVGIEKHGDNVTLVYSHEDPSEMKSFLSRHGLPAITIEVSEFTLR
jgi:hypothetical protein